MKNEMTYILFGLGCCSVFGGMLEEYYKAKERFPGWLADRLVNREVSTLITADPTLTIATCTAQCDSHLALFDAANEALTDQLCADECVK